jgi:hypothetical protein
MEYCEKQICVHVIFTVPTIKILIDYTNRILRLIGRAMGLKSL